MPRQPLPDREGAIVYPRRIAGCRLADAITENGMRLAELEPPLKTVFNKLLPDYVCSINPLAAFSQDAEMAEEDN